MPGLAGSVVVSMCNTRFLAAAERFRELGCKIVWLGCMNWLFPEERRHYRRHGAFDRYVFQSRYQREQLRGQLAKFGYDDAAGADHSRGVRRGGVSVPAAGPRAGRDVRHRPAQPRGAPTSFRRGRGQIYGRVPAPIGRPGDGLGRRGAGPRSGRRRVGPSVCRPGPRRARRFWPRLHCLVQAGGAAVENWPRVGLEAMAAGVPLVVDNRGGWTK